MLCAIIRVWLKDLYLLANQGNIVVYIIDMQGLKFTEEKQHIEYRSFSEVRIDNVIYNTIR